MHISVKYAIICDICTLQTGETGVYNMELIFYWKIQYQQEDYPSVENKMVQTRVGEKIKHSKVIT